MEHRSTASLRGDGQPLADTRVRETVVAAARALAERTGVGIESITVDASQIEVVVSAPEAAAVGFVAELRRSTNAWHAARSGSPLWPSPGRDEAGPGHGDLPT